MLAEAHSENKEPHARAKSKGYSSDNGHDDINNNNDKIFSNGDNNTRNNDA